MNDYLKSLKKDAGLAKEYYLKSIQKSEQQKFLEKILINEDLGTPEWIADVCCGGGTLSYHLSDLFPESHFVLCDYNDDAVALAQQLNRDKQNFDFYATDILEWKPEVEFDIIFCWQSLFVMDKPKEVLLKLIDHLKPGGRIYLSSLFNLHYDVDLVCEIVDHTRASTEANLCFNYNTYSEKTVRFWLEGHLDEVSFHEFIPEVDFSYDGRGMGTRTVKAIGGNRLQISGGYLMNWAILKGVRQ